MSPWWAHPELTVQFFRPLTSLTLAFDAWFVPRGAGLGALAHAHSLLWVAALTLAARRLFTRVLSPSVASVAALLHALTGATAINGAWISARHALIGGTFALLAAEAHLAWRAGAGRAWSPWAWFGLGLLASESALGAAAWVLAFELWGARDAVGARVRAVLPWAVASLGFVVAYRLAGFGVAHSGSYLDPAADPIGAGAVMLARAVALAATGLIAAPAELGTRPGGLEALVVAGVVAVAGAAALTRALADHVDDGDRAALRWALPGGLLAVVPSLPGLMGGRLLMVGGPALLAWVALLAVAAGRAPAARWWVRGGVALLVIPAVITGPLQRLYVAYLLGEVGAQVEAIGVDARALCGPDDDMLVLGASDYGVAAYVPTAMLRREGRLLWRSYRPLTLVPDDVTVTRVDLAHVEVRTATQPLYLGAFERVYNDAPPPAGVPIDAGAFEVVPGADQRSFLLGFRREVPASACFVRFDGARLRRVHLGAIGEPTRVPWAVGPMER
jgi:hypothetical protein